MVTEELEVRTPARDHHTTTAAQVGIEQADCQITVHDCIEDVRDMNSGLARSFMEQLETKTEDEESASLWKKLGPKERNSNLGAGLSARWL
ncbi:hypothetical protein E1162_05130 [Rhodobacteraceae bacterium RKSG542]|uniref:hypothetical protein n=1 Tax=Pseudovibrio flavus TaxID=2529854 RepID=UPI0012BC0342|nr:hypothetical protein [Pseudovibrio flavus]MTI16620.1 hypothetical protein [Pseudovibrio flavus]